MFYLCLPLAGRIRVAAERPPSLDVDAFASLLARTLDDASSGSMHVVLEASEREGRTHVWMARLGEDAVRRVRAYDVRGDVMVVVVNDLEPGTIRLTVEAPRDVAYLDAECMPRVSSARLDARQRARLRAAATEPSTATVS